MNDPATNRTFICSVVFVDLVGYSKRSVSEQLAIKDHFTALLGDALKDIALNDRIVLDTGDGAAMSFLGDPEDALFVGMSLRDALKPQETVNGAGGIRIGINLGPVKLVKDINGHPNIVGDGINVAQRIMSFAEPGQVLVSRSYYDVVSCLSDDYAKLFAYDGSRTDKHVREHEVYVVGDSERAFTRAKAGMERRAAGSGPKPAYKPEAGGEGARGTLLERLTPAVTAFLQDRRKVMIAGGALGAVVLLLAGLLAARKPAAPQLPPSSAQAAAAAPAAPASQSEANPGAAAPAAKPAQAATAIAKAQPAKKEAPKPHAAPGLVKLAIDPWGEVYVNGKSRGVSPPIKSLKLAPGKYRIEVRNSNLAPYDETIEVKSREEVTIRHNFK
jgi:class 3 adenylate cyclase